MSLQRIITIVSACFCFLSSDLYSQGHYNGGSYNANDFFIPPASGWVFSLYYSYADMNYHNHSGKRAENIMISENPPLSLKAEQNVTTESIIPMLIYFGKNKIINARWGVLALPSINNPTSGIALDFYSGQTKLINRTVNFRSYGFGDFYLQPIWLTWENKRLSTTVSYGFWAPTGKYKANDPENLGLGYWSHNIRGASRYKASSKINVMGALTYEFNSGQKGTDFKEASHLTLDTGVSYNFPAGHEIGILGFGNIQLEDDKGTKASLEKDTTYGLGIYGSYWIIPGKLGTLARVTNNFFTQNRFGGISFQIGVNYLFFK
ncbi:transporter [Chryseobacterium sp. Tr-659]|uniref:SphA family protein n=1 Tax=Chryseobacterium sp. Tr-659 TaxID=2608340 RepID=UPI001423638D|nr:transporter [Chryseobacterium sp. Tr-659]NIF07443.1 transporter [Chryseobacterium sp. Tr-659]